MTDFALDPLTRDLILPLQALDGAAKVAQGVGIRLRTWLGEWFLDLSHGVPYVESIFGKYRRPELVEAILRAQILQVSGVKSIQSFSLQIDNSTRKARVDFELQSEFGLVKGTLNV